MKKIKGDKTIGVIIHIYMEISQGNFLCSYIYLKLKCHGFLLQNWRTGWKNKSCPWRSAGTRGGGGPLLREGR
jgi:hypothetical protein